MVADVFTAGLQQVFRKLFVQPVSQLLQVAAVSLQCGLGQSFFKPQSGAEFVDEIGIALHCGAVCM